MDDGACAGVRCLSSQGVPPPRPGVTPTTSHVRVIWCLLPVSTHPATLPRPPSGPDRGSGCSDRTPHAEGPTPHPRPTDPESSLEPDLQVVCERVRVWDVHNLWGPHRLWVVGDVQGLAVWAENSLLCAFTNFRGVNAPTSSDFSAAGPSVEVGAAAGAATQAVLGCSVGSLVSHEPQKLPQNSR